MAFIELKTFPFGQNRLIWTGNLEQIGEHKPTVVAVEVWHIV